MTEAIKKFIELAANNAIDASRENIERVEISGSTVTEEVYQYFHNYVVENIMNPETMQAPPDGPVPIKVEFAVNQKVLKISLTPIVVSKERIVFSFRIS